MDAQQFLAEFGHIANAPGGVARLRELILTLAVQGRLVKQEDDEPASVLIERIRLEKDGLIRRGVLKREKTLAPISKGDLPHRIPSRWMWVRLGMAARKITDGTHHSPASFATGDFKYLSAKNIKPWGIDLSDVTYVPASVHQEIYSRCDPQQGDILYIKDGATTGILTINTLEEPFSLLSSVGLIKPSCGLMSAYLALVMRSPFFYQSMRAGMKGVAITRVTLAKLEAALIPLPPLAEQSRIVAKVDELRALCDRLEAQQQARRKLQNALRQSTLQTLASGQSPHELQDSWQRLQANFGRLFSEPEDVKELRLVVMELAIRGLLTEQLISDGDAAELAFAAPAAAASSTRGRKKTAFLQEEVSESDSPFALPKNWRWARLADIGYFLGGGTPSKSNPDYWQGSIPWVSPKDMKVARINSSQDHISEKALSESAAKLIPAGSLLVVVRGMILAHSFPVGLTSREVAINQDMKALCPHRSDMSEFILLLLAGSKRRFLELVERSTHGTCRLETDRFASCVVGIPPLPEQLRIVETVNQLMLVCDALQSQLNEMQKCSATLAITSVANLIGITIEQEEEAPMNVPQTELIAPLRLGTLPDVKAQAPLATLLVRHNGEMSARDLWQRFGGEIDAFYAQLKTEVAHGWISEPAVAEVREKSSAVAGA